MPACRPSTYPLLLQEGDPEGWWEEEFRGHLDTKPRGPNAIAFDVLMEGVQHVYGIPERASRLSLPASVGMGGGSTCVVLD